MSFIETEASKRQEIINGKSVTVVIPKLILILNLNISVEMLM